MSYKENIKKLALEFAAKSHEHDIARRNLDDSIKKAARLFDDMGKLAAELKGTVDVNITRRVISLDNGTVVIVQCLNENITVEIVQCV